MHHLHKPNQLTINGVAGMALITTSTYFHRSKQPSMVCTTVYLPARLFVCHPFLIHRYCLLLYQMDSSTHSWLPTNQVVLNTGPFANFRNHLWIYWIRVLPNMVITSQLQLHYYNHLQKQPDYSTSHRRQYTINGKMKVGK